MSHGIDGTHDAALASWVVSANEAGTDFPIQNLPLGVFRRGEEAPRVGCAIGAEVLDLRACVEDELLGGLPQDAAEALRASALNAFMALPPEARAALRGRLSALLREGGPAEAVREAARRRLVPRSDVELLLPAAVGDYTDFYASLYHATNVGRMLRPDNPLLPNYKWVPIAYHGRASSLVASGTPVRRPWGQSEPPPSAARPRFAPSQSLDYELEVGAFLGPGNPLGQPIPIEEAERHVVGLVLVNDWSARDVQRWEYQPLGPFLSKSFATSLSPWIVTTEALAPFRAPAFARAADDPEPLPYLTSERNLARGGFDVQLEVLLATRLMRERGILPACVSRSNLALVFWTLAQMVAHHSSNGCALRPGDLIASGTVSGEAKETRGCLLERTWRGQEPLTLPNGETRRFLEDGDEVILRGHCAREGFRRIGFGECRGVVLPALAGEIAAS